MRTYKDIYYLYLSFVLAGALIVGLMIGTTGINRLILIIILIAWLGLTTLVAHLMTKGRDNKLAKLRAEGKLAEYVNSYERVNAGIHDSMDLVPANDIKLKLVDGLYARGEFGEMRRVLDSIQVSQGTDQKDMIQKVRYLNYLALYYIERGQYGEAEAEISDCYPIFDTKIIKEPRRSELIDETEKTYAIIQLKKGNYDGLDKQFAGWVRDSEDPLDKVAASYRLGELYYNHGMTEEANQQFEFVVKYGGDSFYAERAEAAINLKGKHKATL